MEASFSAHKLKCDNTQILVGIDRNRFIATLIVKEILKMDCDILKEIANRDLTHGPFASCISVHGFWKICLIIDKYKEAFKENSQSTNRFELVMVRLKNLDSVKKLLDEDFPEKRKVFVLVKDYEPLSIQIFEKYEKEYRISKSKSAKILNLKYLQVHLMRALNLSQFYGGDEMDLIDWLKFRLEVENFILSKSRTLILWI